jgi:tetratricopeptide (TPR) repeat protein
VPGHGPIVFVALFFAFWAKAHAGAGQAQSAKTPPSRGLPSACLDAGKRSNEIDALLKNLAIHPSAEGYNALGALFGKREQLPCAVESFRQGLHLDPSSWETRYNLALALVSRQEYKPAVEELHAVVQRKPDFFEGRNALGLALQNLGEFDAAADEFKTALKLNPDSAYAASNLAQVYHAQRKYTAEIYYLRQSLDHGPPADLAYSMRLALGIAYENDKNTDLAIEELRKLVADYPQSAEAHYNLATVYAKHVRFKEARPEFEACLRFDPGNDTARLSLAKALAEIGENTSSLLLLNEYIRRVPKDYEGHFVLGEAYRRLGQLDEATAQLRVAAQLNPDNYEVQQKLGMVLMHSKHLDEAISHLEAARKLNPQAPEIPYELAAIYQRKGEPRRAEEEMRAFAEAKRGSQAEDKAKLLGIKANTLLENGDAGGAAEAYRDALKLWPEDAGTHYNLSLALERLGQRKEEEQELREAGRLDPNVPEVRNQLGILCLADGRLAEAERQFKAAREINPTYAEAENNLGALYARQGKGAEALVLLQKACQDDPKYAQAYLNWGLVLAGQGRFEEAKERLHRAIEISPTNAAAYTAMGMTEVKLGHLQESIPIFQKVIELEPQSSEPHVNLGISLGDQHDLRGALDQFSAAIQLDPNSALAHYNRGRVLYDMDKRDDARAELEKAYQLSANYPAPWYLLALLERQANNLALSNEALEKLVVLEPRNAAAQFVLGQNLLQVGKREEAIRRWKIALEADPENREVLLALAQTLDKAGSPEAKRYRDRLEALEKTRGFSDRVQRLNDSALEAANARNWPQAVAQMGEALEACGQCQQLPILHRNLGLIYARAGDIPNSERELRLALKLKPDDVDALKAIEILERRGPTRRPQ